MNNNTILQNIGGLSNFDIHTLKVKNITGTIINGTDLTINNLDVNNLSNFYNTVEMTDLKLDGINVQSYIETNREDIETLNSLIIDEGGINDLISTNTQDISTINGLISNEGGINDLISTNTQDISTLNGLISDEGGIYDLISTNTQDISTIDGLITGETGINYQIGLINIEIGTQSEDIYTNTQNISTNSEDIITLDDTINKSETGLLPRIIVIEEAIGDLEDLPQLIEDVSAIEEEIGDLATIREDVSTLQGITTDLTTNNMTINGIKTMADDLYLSSDLILNTGNIGINNITPQYKVDLQLTSSSATPEFIRFDTNDSSLCSGLLWAPSFGSYTKTSAMISAINEGNYFRSGLTFHTNNTEDISSPATEKMRLTMDGNLNLISETGNISCRKIGLINNTAPRTAIDMAKFGDLSSCEYISFGCHSSNLSGGIRWCPNSSTYTKLCSGIFSIGEASWFRQGLAFYTGNNSDATTDAIERMRIDRYGNLKITSGSIYIPDNAHHYIGASNDLNIYHSGTNSYITNITGNLEINTSNNLNLTASNINITAPINFTSSDGFKINLSSYLGVVGNKIGTSTGWSFDFHAARGEESNNQGKFRFLTSTVSGYVERLKIDNTGYIGINITTPTELLEVNGNIKINDSQYIKIGSGNDLNLYHNGTNSYISNITGDLIIQTDGSGSGIILDSENDTVEIKYSGTLGATFSLTNGLDINSININSTSPILTLVNSSDEYSDESQESIIYFKNKNNNNLGYIKTSHLGEDDTDEGTIKFYVNNGSALNLCLTLTGSYVQSNLNLLSSGFISCSSYINSSSYLQCQSSSPLYKLTCVDSSYTDGSKLSTINFLDNSSIMGSINVSHDGIEDDTKGKFKIQVSDGTDLIDAITINSDGTTTIFDLDYSGDGLWSETETGNNIYYSAGSVMINASALVGTTEKLYVNGNEIISGSLMIGSTSLIDDEKLNINGNIVVGDIDCDDIGCDNIIISDTACISSTTGKLGITNSTPSYAVDLAKSSSSVEQEFIRFGCHNTTSSLSGGLIWKARYGSYSKISSAIYSVCEANYFRQGLAFYTANNADISTDATEKMRLNMNGDLLLKAGDLSLIDNKKIKIGTGYDLNLYHDGSSSYIKNTTGSIHYESTSGHTYLDLGGYTYLIQTDSSTIKTISSAGIDTLYYSSSWMNSGARNGRLFVSDVTTNVGNSLGVFNGYSTTACIVQGPSAYNDYIYWVFKGGNNVNYWARIPSGGYFSITGQHYCHVDDDDEYELKQDETLINYVGLIIISTGKIKDPITINDAKPCITLTTNYKDKRVFGVITDRIDEKGTEPDYILFNKEGFYNPVEEKIRINSLGEGGIYVISSVIDGIVQTPIENGDYITSSNLKAGYGIIQDDDLLHNYTVAKATIDCNFELNNNNYNCYSNEDDSLRWALISCTYHCG